MTSMARNDLPLELANVGVRPADRLGFTMMIAALILTLIHK